MIWLRKSVACSMTPSRASTLSSGTWWWVSVCVHRYWGFGRIFLGIS
uniref:Uncharacterized protein n=1 Tax=Arundo donax TaxID=35708 RepID=A0A0A9HR06_ARUDO